MKLELSADAVTAMLHPRILAACGALYNQLHYKHAAREAMTEVEIALKEKCFAPVGKDYGQRLIDYAFSAKGAVFLRTPFDPKYRQQATALFKAGFAYYRNYAAHDGRQIDGKSALRILILASELMDMIDASVRSLRNEGGPEGLVAHGHFESVSDIKRFLHFMDGQYYQDEVWDGLLESLANAGFDWEQINLMEELGLLHERSEPMDEESGSYAMTIFELTQQGKGLVASIKT